MQELNPSAKRPSGWRRAKFVAGTLALTMGALGAGLAATAAPAWANASTNSYLIGSQTGAVSSVTISPTVATSLASTTLDVFFKPTAALVGGNIITVTSSVALGAVTGVEVIDSPTCLQAGGGVVAGTTLTVTLEAAGCSIAVGDSVEVAFTYTAPNASSETFSVTTTNNGTASSAVTLTINKTPPTLAASSYTTGYNAQYTIGDIGATGANGGSWATFPLGTGVANDIELTATADPSPGGGFALYNGIAGYSVSYIPSGGSATADAITAFDPAGSAFNITPGAQQAVFLTLTTAIPANAVVTVTAEGTNGGTANTSTAFAVIPESTPALASQVGSQETTNTITFGSSMTALEVTPSTGLAGASSNYLISFTAGSVTTTQICFSEPNDSTNFSTVTGVLVTDTTGAWQLVPAIGTVTHGAALVAGCGGFYQVVIPITGPPAETIKAGDAVTVLLAGVTNPAAQTVSDFVGATFGDQLADTAAPYAITISAAGGISVTVSPPSVGSLSTYTISNIVVSSGGVAAGAFITITAVPPAAGGTADTTFPNNPADYVITDTTTKAGSGVATLVTGAPSQSVTITVPNALTAGDIISITVNDSINPTGAASYSLNLVGNVQGPTVVAPSFPQANVTYPDGAIVNFSGTDYLFAGGHAFGIPTVAVLQSLQTVDPAVTITAPAGALVPSAAPLLGTTIIVYNNPTIYVVGASGLNGFSTTTQFLGDGYDPADVITVPSFGGLSVGATVGSVGTADNAIGTVANGAIIDSSGTFYVIAGAHAFGIPTLAALSIVQAGDTSTPLVGTVPSGWTTSVIANGTLITTNGAVYNSDGGDLFEFKTLAQLVADGFGGTPSIVTANFGGIPIVTSYLGS